MDDVRPSYRLSPFELARTFLRLRARHASEERRIIPPAPADDSGFTDEGPTAGDSDSEVLGAGLA
jgi:hypothetical protein